MENTNLQDYSHKRYNILTGEWVLVSPHRAKRPWQGQNEEISTEKRPSYDENCYLCPTNTRINGEVNPDYKDVFVFTNDFAALQKDSPTFSVNDGLFKAESEKGICKVICFSPDHSKSLAEMEVEDIKKIVHVWQEEYATLGENEMINYVQIFENKGAVMGCSNPHPHGQIWSQSTLPNEVDKKDRHQKEYFNKNNTSLLADYLLQELEAKERIIFENDDFVVLTPFWAVWPFEVMIAPKKAKKNILELSDTEARNYAKAISVITSTYDKLFNTSFPYSSGIHQAPTNGEENEHWHFHMSFYPPLLRSATVKKFMVGYEMFGTPQRDITAEIAAKRLRDLL
ncbi:galactose-1-phosphate uridylyltransferase [Polaribacter reichenbachii]|uniref:Galactose-1-phosphate uridylyltransferase n=1 Tax=Polaribacter reichenbachii TaxID=996801 RepID=A0A1B8U7H1_9FLAO|nr:UDP-glucose--hexose-1-phosphate uridylyltransferase [Polaribacter reichenbachii]APZ46404.1 galactose-1-phosphate uridylyltransferase [Polaribacter reichenbachii]AUC20269.1 galactose-1-phosphate uridylyltransferase [Polaribacter reichenbachii]OBY67833.1 galactose-1-phosphate uridylyltransferase [Polaribacter reichenbachii]